MKLYTLCLAVVIFCVHDAQAQKGSGRSNTGSLPAGHNGKVDPNAAKTPRLSFEMDFTEPSGNSYLDAKETGRLKLIITNIGKTPVRNVVAKLTPTEPPTGVTFIDSIKVGDIPVGGARYAIFYVTAATSVSSQTLKFQILVFDQIGPASEPRILTFSTRALSSAD